MQLHIVINTENKCDLQKIAALLSEFEIDSMGWSTPKPGPVYRDVPKGAGGQGFVEAARGVQPAKNSAIDLD